MKRLKELYIGIKKLRLMGGEPLLNKQLPLYIQTARNIFEDCEIRIVTNGLLIQNNKAELFRCMKENNCGFDISAYPPTIENLNTIKKTLNNFQVQYQITDIINKFYKQYCLEKNKNIKKIYQNCGSKNCHFLRNGRIAACPFILLKDIVNNEYSINLNGDDGIDLYEDTLDGWSLNKRLNSPSVLCQYCSDTRIWYKWSGRRTRTESLLSDWFVTKKERKRYIWRNEFKEKTMNVLLLIKHHFHLDLNWNFINKLKKWLKY